MQGIVPPDEVVTLDDVNAWLAEEDDDEAEMNHDDFEFDTQIDCDRNEDEMVPPESQMPKTKIEDGLNAVRLCLKIATEHSSFEHVHNLQKFQEYLITQKLNSITQTTIGRFFQTDQ